MRIGKSLGSLHLYLIDPYIYYETGWNAEKSQ